MPFDLHHRLARDASLERQVLAIFINELQRQLREAADAWTGTVTGTQHFGGSLNLHGHFHVVALDGVCEQESSGTMTFTRAPAPTQAQIEALARRVATLVRELVGQPQVDAEPIAQAPVLRLFGAAPGEPALPRLAAEHAGSTSMQPSRLRRV